MFVNVYVLRVSVLMCFCMLCVYTLAHTCVCLLVCKFVSLSIVLATFYLHTCWSDSCVLLCCHSFFSFVNVCSSPPSVRMVADAEHSLVGHQIDVSLAVTTFYRSIMLKKPIPTFDWTRDPETGKIVVTMGDKKPYQVLKWHATNHKVKIVPLLSCLPLWRLFQFHKGV